MFARKSATTGLLSNKTVNSIEIVSALPYLNVHAIIPTPAFEFLLMNDFDISLSNSKGLTLTARVKYIYPDHFIVDIHHLKLTLRVIRNQDGKLECEQAEELHSNLVKDVCLQINDRLQKLVE